jgi:hypothetical protein
VAGNYATYLGSIFMDGTNGQISCHNTYGQSRKWGVWNAYNRDPITLLMGDSTASWTYSTATIRQSNAAAGNALTTFWVWQKKPSTSPQIKICRRVAPTSAERWGLASIPRRSIPVTTP